MKFTALFEGRKNAAGSKKLAAFFLLTFICIASLCATDMPFSVNGKLYLLSGDDSVTELKTPGQCKFIQRGVAASKKVGLVLAWDQKSQQLLHIDSKGAVKKSVPATGNSAFLNSEYLLLQSSAWTENRGFEFTLCEINYSKFGGKISLKTVWNGYLDCFVSDYIFTRGGVCVAGGTKDNATHNVYVISASGIHKCFSMPKTSDFLRLLKMQESDTLYAFVSQREKINAPATVYAFAPTARTDQTTAVKFNLQEQPLLPSAFECFFGYGFSLADSLVLPCSVDGTISFVKFNPTTAQITSVTPDAVGCNFPLFKMNNSFYYIARDPLIPGSYFGIACFDGKKVLKTTLLDSAK